MKNGYLKIGAFTPEIKVCDVDFNKKSILNGISLAQKEGVEVLVFPELSLVGSTAGDLLYSSIICEKSLNALKEICIETQKIKLLFFVGVPLNFNGRIYNTLAVMNEGKILAFIPKENVDGSRFSNVIDGIVVTVFGEKIPLTNKIIFVDSKNQKVRISAEIGEDILSVVSPSSHHSIAGVNIVVNAASFAYTMDGKVRIKEKIKSQSKNCKVAYVLCNSGEGESTGDEVFAGYNLIAEDGELLKESTPFKTSLTTALIDLDYLETNRNNCEENYNDYMVLEFSSFSEREEGRIFEKYPFIPKGKSQKEVMEDVIEIQAEGLKKRLVHTGAKKLVLGLSGGLDSTLALLVAIKTMAKLGRSNKDVVTVTMPCFGTTSRTLENSIKLARITGTTLKKIDISKAVTRHLKDIGHSGSKYDAAFENAQARERTQVLMDLANMEGGIVVGTGDMSELALGWATYNGDHMSMYGVNSGIPKTLVKFLVKTYAENSKPKLKAVLLDIVGTPVSPELIPVEGNEIKQKTEDLVGPYALHDFYLYHVIYRGFEPKKVYEMARCTFEDEFDKETIKKWLEVFIRRFFSQQFKRSCLPDGAKVFDFSLSPRGGFKMPSDALATVWLEQIKKI